MNSSNEVCCPKCGSNQITANKKGFSGKKAVGGAILTGGIGILAGTIGSNKIVITCLNCGNQFKPGETFKPKGIPALIWDENLKKHIVNPNRSSDVAIMPLWKVLIGLVLFIFILYLLLK